MAQWLKSQLKVAENLLEAVDKKVSSAVGNLNNYTATEIDSSSASETLSQLYDANLERRPSFSSSTAYTSQSAADNPPSLNTQSQVTSTYLQPSILDNKYQEHGAQHQRAPEPRVSDVSTFTKGYDSTQYKVISGSIPFGSLSTASSITGQHSNYSGGTQHSNDSSHSVPVATSVSASADTPISQQHAQPITSPPIEPAGVTGVADLGQLHTTTRAEPVSQPLTSFPGQWDKDATASNSIVLGGPGLQSANASSNKQAVQLNTEPISYAIQETDSATSTLIAAASSLAVSNQPAVKDHSSAHSISPGLPRSTPVSAASSNSNYVTAVAADDTGLQPPTAPTASPRKVTYGTTSTGSAGLASSILASASYGLFSSVQDSEQGANKEQQLSKLVDQLRKRLDAVNHENQQLEVLLHRTEDQLQAEKLAVRQANEELQALQGAKAFSESTLQAQLSQLHAAHKELAAKYQATQKQVERLQNDLAVAEEQNQQLAQSKSEVEGNVVEGLKAELVSAEARLESERCAHQASRAAASSREHELSQQLADSHLALAEVQRAAEDAGSRVRELEEQLALTSQERNKLAAQLESIPHSDRQLQTPASAELETLRTEIQQLRRSVQLAEQARTTAESKLATILQDYNALKDAAAKHKDSSQLEHQLREMSDMLYLKQTQLERLAADKAAQQLKLERDLAAFKDEALKLKHQLSQHTDSHGADIIPMDALGEPYQRLTRSKNLGQAVRATANFVDRMAARVAFFLRQYPLFRVLILLYFVLIHLYIYWLISWMQRQAMTLETTVHPPVR